MFRLIVVAAFFAMLLPTAHGATIVQDQFLSGTNPASGQYVDGAVLNGTSPTGGTILGFSGPWTANDEGIYGIMTTVAGGLSYEVGPQRLETSGGALSWYRSHTNNSSKNNVRANSDTTTDNDWYASALVRFADTSNDQILDIRLSIADVLNFGVNAGRAFVEGNIDSTVLANDTTHLLVIRGYEVGDGDTEDVYLWVDPLELGVDGSGVPLAPPKLIGTSTGNNIHNVGNPLTQVNAYLSWGYGSNLMIDEIRVGQSWADVVPFGPVPEPSTLAMLLGLGGLGLLGYLRRRRRS